MNQLFVQTDGLRSYARIHDEIAAGLSELIGAEAPEAAGAQISHGTIAAAAGAALSSALESRHGGMQTTARSAATISELLQKAAQMYEQGDRQGAEKLRAAAEALEDRADGQGVTASGAAGASDGTGFPGGAGIAAGAGTPVGGSQMIGQTLSQVGQQVGQLAGSLTAPLLGLAQGLQQVPQQVMQGVQQAAHGVAGSARDGQTRPVDEDEAERTRKPSDRRTEEPAEPTDRAEPTADGAASGDPAIGDWAPAAPVGEERSRPAPTRPQTH